jgi:hypothetical protein
MVGDDFSKDLEESFALTGIGSCKPGLHIGHIRRMARTDVHTQPLGLGCVAQLLGAIRCADNLDLVLALVSYRAMEC